MNKNLLEILMSRNDQIRINAEVVSHDAFANAIHEFKQTCDTKNIAASMIEKSWDVWQRIVDALLSSNDFEWDSASICSNFWTGDWMQMDFIISGNKYAGRKYGYIKIDKTNNLWLFVVGEWHPLLLQRIVDILVLTNGFEWNGVQVRSDVWSKDHMKMAFQMRGNSMKLMGLIPDRLMMMRSSFCDTWCPKKVVFEKDKLLSQQREQIRALLSYIGGNRKLPTELLRMVKEF